MSPNERQHRRRILKRRPRRSAPRQHRRPNTKVTGERSEGAFLARALQMNFGVAKPWGDSRRYDFILDNGEILIRIQVKCTEGTRADAYETRATYDKNGKHIPYTKKDCDFIAAHVVPLDLWYIVPVEVSERAPMLRFYPHRKPKYERLEQYKESWHLILPSTGLDDNGRIEIQACADPDWDPDWDEDDDSNAHQDYGGSDAEACLEQNRSVRPASEASVASAGIPQREASADCASATSANAAFRLKDVIPDSAGEEPALKPSPLAPQTQLTAYRELLAQSPLTNLNPNLAPWPIPKVKILARREGKHLLPTSQPRRGDR